MTIANQISSMFSGDTKDLVFTSLSGTPYDGATIIWTLKRNGGQVLQKTTSNGITVSGTTFTVRLESADTAGITGKCHYVAKVTDMFGKLSTSATGDITFV